MLATISERCSGAARSPRSMLSPSGSTTVPVMPSRTIPPRFARRVMTIEQPRGRLDEGLPR